MSRIPLSLAGVVGLVAALFIAAPAQAATYGVSMYYDVPQGDVGQTIKISGAVAGSGSTNKTLTVQRKVGSAAWTNVGTVKTGGNSKYYFFHKVSAVGAQQFRVVAPKAGSTAQGVSTPKAFTGWTWLNLAQQPVSVSGGVLVNTSPTVIGVKRPNSIEMYQNSSSVFWVLDNQCDQSKIYFGTYDGGGTASGTVGTDEGSAGHSVTSGSATSANHVATASNYLEITRTSSSGTLILISPRVHCSIAQLPDPAL